MAAVSLVTTCVVAQPAYAAFGCTVTQTNFGASSCAFTAIGLHGTLNLTLSSGAGAAEVICLSGGYAFRASNGSSNFSTVPGDQCNVYVYVDTTTGRATGTAISSL